MPEQIHDAARLYGKLTEAFNQRDWRRAVELAATLIPQQPQHPGMYYIAGIAHLELQIMPQALEYLRRAVVLEPSNPDYAVQFAKALLVVGRNRDARGAAEHARKLAPSSPLLLDTLGVIFSQIGAYDVSAAVFRKAVEAAPEHSAYHYNLATALVAGGKLDEAEVEIEACLALDPRYWRAHMTLAQLHKQTTSNNHIERLEALHSEINGTTERAAHVCINMALAKEHEDLSHYPKALEHYVLGKSVGKAERNYTTERDRLLFQAIEESFPQARLPPEGFDTDEPIFVMGMPRSGTTLVERIISSHPQVETAGELLNFPLSIKDISTSRTPTVIDAGKIIGARNPDWKKLGELYLASTRPATGNKPHFVDKLPHNFLYAGFIAHALPNAKIVCLRRNPMDTCLSNFRQLFAPGSPYFDYSFDLLDIGRYYVLFDRLMAHWQRVIPGRILEVQYETLVDEQEPISRQIIEFCGLEWDDSCLRFEQNPAPVATASAVQVRAPMYRTSLRRWKKYGSQLEELYALLREAGVANLDL